MAFQFSIDGRRDHFAISTPVRMGLPLNVFLRIVDIKQSFHLILSIVAN